MGGNIRWGVHVRPEITVRCPGRSMSITWWPTLPTSPLLRAPRPIFFSRLTWALLGDQQGTGRTPYIRHTATTTCWPTRPASSCPASSLSSATTWPRATRTTSTTQTWTPGGSRRTSCSGPLPSMRAAPSGAHQSSTGPGGRGRGPVPPATAWTGSTAARSSSSPPPSWPASFPTLTRPSWSRRSTASWSGCTRTTSVLTKWTIRRSCGGAQWGSLSGDVPVWTVSTSAPWYSGTQQTSCRTTSTTSTLHRTPSLLLHT